MGPKTSGSRRFVSASRIFGIGTNHLPPPLHLLQRPLAGFLPNYNIRQMYLHIIHTITFGAVWWLFKIDPQLACRTLLSTHETTGCLHIPATATCVRDAGVKGNTAFGAQ
jgi:hypothetical protein